MARKKLTLETARKKWATQSANLALLLGERIKLIYIFSLEADQLRTQPDGGLMKILENGELRLDWGF